MSRHEPLTRLGEVRGRHNLVGAFEDVGAARTVIEALEASGIDGSDLSLLGAQPAANEDEVAAAAQDTPGWRLFRRSTAGALAGAFVGGGIGILAFPALTWPVAALLGAVVGSMVGWFIAGALNIGIAGAWSDTFRDIREGTVAVGVHSDDPTTIDRAAAVMSNHGPLSMNRFDG